MFGGFFRDSEPSVMYSIMFVRAKKLISMVFRSASCICEIILYFLSQSRISSISSINYKINEC